MHNSGFNICSWLRPFHSSVYAVISCWFLFVAGPAIAAQWQVVYLKPEYDNNKLSQYPIDVLKLALEKTGVNYQLMESSTRYTQQRAFQRLDQNLDINVMWSMTSSEREAAFLPIRIPLVKGLIGWRLLLTRRDSEFFKTDIDSINDLRKFRPVQGQDWPDTRILQANGFDLFTVNDFRQAVTALSQQEADVFPRSVLEVTSELNNLDRSLGLVLKPRLGLRYPVAMYLFVRKNDKGLAKLLESGLRRALEDGSFNALFEETFRTELAVLRNGETKFFQLSNPYMPALTPVSERNLWFIKRPDILVE